MACGEQDALGYPTQQAVVGGFLVAEAIAIFRDIHAGLVKAGKRKGRRRGRR